MDVLEPSELGMQSTADLQESLDVTADFDIAVGGRKVAGRS